MLMLSDRFRWVYCQPDNLRRLWHDESTGMFSPDAFKIVYVALMKALILQEMVGNLNSHQGPFCTKVGELTCNSQMTSSLMRFIFSMVSIVLSS